MLFLLHYIKCIFPITLGPRHIFSINSSDCSDLGTQNMTRNTLGIQLNICHLLGLAPPSAEILKEKQFLFHFLGPTSSLKHQPFLTASQRSWDALLPTGPRWAFHCAYRPGIISNKAVEAKWPSSGKIKSVGKLAWLNLNYTICYCKVGVCFS